MRRGRWHNFVGTTGSTSCGDINNTYHLETQLTVLNYALHDLTSANRDAVDWAMVNRVAPTDIVVSGTPGDATYYDAAYMDYCNRDWTSGGGNVISHARCAELHGTSNMCGWHQVRFDLAYTNNASTSALRGLACHETGHVLGFRHPRTIPHDSCLYRSAKFDRYSQHEVDEINRSYY